MMSLSRIRLASLHDKVMSAEQAARFIENDMTVGLSLADHHWPKKKQ